MKITRLIFTTLVIIIFNLSLFGQEVLDVDINKDTLMDKAYHNFGLIILSIMLILISSILSNAFKIINHYYQTSEDIEERLTIGQRIYKHLTGTIPIEKEDTIDLGHNYDSIRELDNNLPPWWLYMFYISILFSGIYMWWYHIGHMGPDQNTEYVQAMEIGQKNKEAYLAKMADAINEDNVTALTPDKAMEGKELFKTYCVACHLESGGGSVGPNLTDVYWLHGGGVKNIFKTIKYGVPEKGMVAWKEQLRPNEIQLLSSYILTLAGTNPPNAKAPQGELYTEGAAPVSQDTSKQKS